MTYLVLERRVRGHEHCYQSARNRKLRMISRVGATARALTLHVQELHLSRHAVLPTAHPSVVWTPLPDGAVLFSTETELYFGVNSVGALVWELLPPTTQTLQDLCAAVHERYPDAALEQIRTDVIELLDNLSQYGLVQFRDAA